MVVENETKDIYIASIYLDESGDLSNCYVLSKQTDLDNFITDIMDKDFSISKFFEGIKDGYKIEIVDPSYKKYKHY